MKGRILFVNNLEDLDRLIVVKNSADTELVSLAYAGACISGNRFIPKCIRIFGEAYFKAIKLVIDLQAVNRRSRLAKFQSKAGVFAGLLIPYRKGRAGREKKVRVTKKEIKAGKVKVVQRKIAILGGGDMGFPLIFAGVVLQKLLLVNPGGIAFLKALIVPLAASLALFFLLISSKKDRFYPAMPFLTAGCFIGYGLLWIVNLF